MSPLRKRVRDARFGPAADLGASTFRYTDPDFSEIAVKVFPGEHHVTQDGREMLVTILGSCVSACIRDAYAGVGGMNHFMLPEAGHSTHSGWDTVSSGMRYGNVAMERLINDILVRGGRRERLEIKVFGGGNVMKASSNIGHRNADFVEAYLAAEGLSIAAAHLRGTLARRVHYFPATGKVMMLELQPLEEIAALQSETLYKAKLETEPVAGSAELF
jgi:chemotaxis protein CheD